MERIMVAPRIPIGFNDQIAIESK